MIDTNSAFAPDNLLPAILITLTRIYDAQMGLLGAIDAEAALALSRAHEQGMLLAPPPAFLGADDLDPADAPGDS